MWVVVDIGCIECGEASAIEGVYGHQQDADRAAAALAECDPDGSGAYSFFTDGQHTARVFEMPPVQ